MRPQISPAAFAYFQEPGGAYLSPAKFAKTFSLDVPSLARLMNANAGCIRHHPEAPEIQNKLSEFLAVYSAILESLPNQNVVDAAFHFRNTPHREFGYRTLFEVVEAGNAEGALGFIHSISSGFVG